MKSQTTYLDSKADSGHLADISQTGVAPCLRTDVLCLLEVAAMSVTEADIKKLKTELRRDLDALERVEAMLHRNASNGHSNSSIGTAPPSVPNGSGRDLRGIVLKILHDAKLSQKSLRPSEIARLAQETDYPFKSHKNAMGSVTKVLTRLKNKTLIERLPDGTYKGR